MKRIITAAALLCIIVIYSVYTLFELKSKNNELKSMIHEIQSVYESGDTERALYLSNELNNYWHKYEKSVTLIIKDEALSNLNISIAKITPFISNENAELVAEIQSVYHQIDQIYEEEFPSWYNIF